MDWGKFNIAHHALLSLFKTSSNNKNKQTKKNKRKETKEKKTEI